MRHWKTISITALALGAVMAVGLFTIAPSGNAAAAGKDGKTPAGARMGMRGHAGKMAKELNLTTEQKARIRSIAQQARKDAMQVLTPEQRQQLGKSVRGEARGVKKSLNLTADQQAKMQAIRSEARAKAKGVKENAGLSDADKRAQLRTIRQEAMQNMRQVLTPAQQQQVKGQMTARRGQRVAHALKLTADQKTKLQAIRSKAAADIRAQLNAEQQQKFDQFQQGWQGRRGKIAR